MNEPNEPNASAELSATVARLAAAAEALDAAMTRVIQHVGQQNDVQGELSTKVDRIVAALDFQNSDESGAARRQLEARVAELERTNTELKAQAAQLTERAARKTLPPLMTTLLAKNGVDNVAQERIEAATLDKTLAALSVEQRIAVKAEMARAGLIE